MADKVQTVTVGPFIGMNDANNLAAQDGKRAAYLENMFAPSATIDGDVLTRPGVTRLDFTRSITRVSFGSWNLTGTVTFSAGSAAVTGSGTAFLTELAANEWIREPVSGDEYQILSVNSNGSLTLTGVAATNRIGLAMTGETIQNASTPSGFIVVSPLNSVAVGDIVNLNASQTAIVTASSLGGYRWAVTASGSTGGYVNTATVNAGGIIGGKVYGAWLYQTTTGAVKRFLIATTTSALVTGAAVGKYRFLGGSSEKIRLIEYDPSQSILTLVDRTSASMDGVALSLLNRIYAVTFANYFILTDGTNRPRKVTSAFVLSNMTDANYAFSGPMWVYYGKLFGIDASDNATFRWSEENDPDTGYGTGTSENVWTLRQTSNDALTVGIGTNDANYGFRRNSITAITGAANSDFRSAGTLDAISTSIGTRSPDTVCICNTSIFFLDQYGRPGRIEPGAGYVPLYDRVAETIRGNGITDAQLQQAWARFVPALNLVVCAYRASTSATTNDQMLVYDTRTWECVGIWKLPKDTSRTVMDHAFGSVWLDENNKPRLVVCSGTSTDLAFYIQKTDDDQLAASVDTISATSVTVQGKVYTPKLGGDPIIEKQFNRIIVGVRNIGGTIAVPKAAYRSPYGDFGTLTAMVLSGSTSSYAGAATKVEYKGTDWFGRWGQVIIQNDVANNPSARFTVDTITVMAQGSDTDYQRR